MATYTSSYTNPVFEEMKGGETVAFNITLTSSDYKMRSKVCKYVCWNLEKWKTHFNDDGMVISCTTPDRVTTFLTLTTQNIDAEYDLMNNVLDKIEDALEKMQEEGSDDFKVMYRRGGLRAEMIYENGTCVSFNEFEELVPYKMDVVC